MTALMLIIVSGWPDTVRVQQADQPNIWIDYRMDSRGVYPLNWSCELGKKLRESGADQLARMSA